MDILKFSQFAKEFWMLWDKFMNIVVDIHSLPS